MDGCAKVIESVKGLGIIGMSEIHWWFTHANGKVERLDWS
jgi:hypothetical protein